MKKWTAIWRMVRPLNLFIIAFTMIGTWLALSSLFGFYQQFGNLILQTIGLCLLAAGGNVINDIQDEQSDSHNKKARNRIGKEISPAQGQHIYWILTLSGLLLSLIHLDLGLSLVDLPIYLFVAASLWLYSSKLQQQVLMGNVVVAIMCAVPVFLGGQVVFGNGTDLLDVLNWENTSTFIPPRFDLIKPVWSFYLFFAFALTLLREIIKDIEDTPGDRAAGYKTLPIKHGLNTAKGIALILAIIISMVEIGFIYQSYLFKADIPWAWLVGVLLVIAPMIATVYAISRLKTEQDAGKISGQLKGVMALGLLTLLYFAFL